MKVIDAIQQDLQALYELDPVLDVRDFVTSDAHWLCRVTGNPAAREVPEQLVLLQGGGDGIEVSLYLDSGLLAALEAKDPSERLDADNLACYVTAAEGVSHLLYLAHNAAHDRQITGFEMELQAEIDKFFLVQLTLLRQGRRPPAGLPALLFRPRFRAGLSGSLLRRYRRANAWAARYCCRHWRRWLEGESLAWIWRDLRRCYRLLHRRKLAHIHRVTRDLTCGQPAARPEGFS